MRQRETKKLGGERYKESKKGKHRKNRKKHRDIVTTWQANRES